MSNLLLRHVYLYVIFHVYLKADIIVENEKYISSYFVEVVRPAT